MLVRLSTVEKSLNSRKLSLMAAVKGITDTMFVVPAISRASVGLELPDASTWKPSTSQIGMSLIKVNKVPSPTAGGGLDESPQLTVSAAARIAVRPAPRVRFDINCFLPMSITRFHLAALVA